MVQLCWGDHLPLPVDGPHVAGQGDGLPLVLANGWQYNLPISSFLDSCKLFCSAVSFITLGGLGNVMGLGFLDLNCSKGSRF